MRPGAAGGEVEEAELQSLTGGGRTVNLAESFERVGVRQVPIAEVEVVVPAHRLAGEPDTEALIGKAAEPSPQGWMGELGLDLTRCLLPGGVVHVPVMQVRDVEVSVNQRL